MRKIFSGLALLTAAAALPMIPAVAAKGDPQRSDEVPPGLVKILAKIPPGIMRALAATEGSNSRLQDLPASP
jgi:hypothetical protein